MRLFCLIIGLLSLTSESKGLTILPAEIDQNTILTKEFSPYLVQYDVTVNDGIVLQIDPGVIIEFGSYATLTLNGKLVARGTPVDSIYFLAQNSALPWYRINAASADIDLQYCHIRDGMMLLFASGGNDINISHCSLKTRGTGGGEDCIAVHDTKKVTLSYISLTGTGGTIAEGHKIDAFDLDNVDSCFIFNNTITRFGDDGIDIGTGSKYALISSNLISYCNYGISVGELSSAYIDHNIIAYCDAALQVHNEAVIYCNYNTLYHNTWGIECFHSEEGDVQSGGTAFIQNTIFSATDEQEILTQTSSSLTLSYSLSDKEVLPGNNNLLGDPQFKDPENGDFSLQSTSPCINAGSPDGEGKPTTIGAIQANGNPLNLYNKKLANRVFLIYPNPSNGIIRIESLLNNTDMDIEYYDSSGRLLVKNTVTHFPAQLNISRFPAGLYYLRVSAGQFSTVAKIIKE